MDPRLFRKQNEAQAAMVTAIPPLMDNYCLAPQQTTDGHTIGAPDLLDITPQGQLRDAVLGFRPVSGWNLVAYNRIRT